MPAVAEAVINLDRNIVFGFVPQDEAEFQLIEELPHPASGLRKLEFVAARRLHSPRRAP